MDVNTISDPYTYFRTWSMIVVSVVTKVLAGNIQEYCLLDSFEASCPEDHVIVMEHAYYGRMSTGRCMKETFGVVGCQTNVIELLDSKCSGRQYCNLPIDFIPIESGIEPCTDDLKSHMEASYSCIPVVTPSESQCRSNNFYMLPTPSGNLASDVIDTRGSGHDTCPWRILTSPGQRINLTLYDFSVWQHNQDVSETTGHTVCQRYATISERDGARETPICGGDIRIRSIYVSIGNFVEIQLVKNKSPEQQYFLIKYETFGCAGLKTQKNAHLSWSGSQWAVKCNYTDERWPVHCDGNSWVGNVGTCSSAKNSIWEVFTRNWSSSYGLMIAVVLGIAVVVIMCFVLLITALVCRRYRDRNPHDEARPRVKTLTEDEIEDPFIGEHTYTLPYNGQPDYASRINQQTLPLPTRGNASLKRNTLPYNGVSDYASRLNQQTLPLPTRGSASLKRNARAGPLVEPRTSHESAFTTLQRQSNSGSAYESPKYLKQDSSPIP